MAPWKRFGFPSFDYPKGNLGKEVMGGVEKIFSGKAPDSARGKCPLLRNEHMEDFCNINDSPARLTKMAVDGKQADLQRLINERRSRLFVCGAGGRTLLHYAAESGQLQMMDFLIQAGIQVDEKDDEGETALHLAVMKDKEKVVQALIALKADLYARNQKQETAMHMAARTNSVNALQCLLESMVDSVDIPGYYCETPLHLSCSFGYLDCVRLLMKHGASCLAGGKMGLSACHIAAGKAQPEVVMCILNESGIPREALLGKGDEENRTPLHWAVIKGDVNMVKLLIEHGSQVDAQTCDQSTPLHLACSQGLLDIVEQVHRSVGSGDFQNILGVVDAQGMTPLHRAVMFDHENVTRFLLLKGAPVDVQDNEGRTPLTLASTRSSFISTAVLLDHGADPTIQDNYGKNYLHYYITHGLPLDCAYMKASISKYAGLLNAKDKFGCTPLHYAAQNGFLQSSNSLVSFGATVNARNKGYQSPFHFAAKYGRFNTVKSLLDSCRGQNIINDSDAVGHTALHAAAENGHCDVVQLLMARGALTHKAFNGQTPLHLAAANNYREVCRLFVVHYTYLLDSIDRNGDTALHLAAANNASKVIEFLLTAGATLLLNNSKQSAIDVAIQNRHQEAATSMVLHDRWEEILTQLSPTYGWPVLGLIEHLPDVMLIALDRCIVRKADSHPLSREFYIEFRFNLLEPPGLENVAYANELNREALKALNVMVRHGRTDLLSHGVCSSYINNKWAHYGLPVYGLNLAVYSLFLALLTYLVISGVQSSLVPSLKIANYENIVAFSDENKTFNTQDPRISRWMPEKAGKVTGFKLSVMVLICIFTGLNMAKELIQLYHQRGQYFRDFANYMEWFLYISSTVFVLGGCQDFEEPVLFIGWRVRWQLGAFAIFIAWFNFMLYLQRFGLMGIYVVMFLGVLKTLARALLVFACLIVAFSLAFHVLLPLNLYPNDEDFFDRPNLVIDINQLRTAHGHVSHSLIRVISMLLGDFDTINNYINPMLDHTMPFPEVTYFFFLAFVVTVSILLMNLLIGLAVGDIEQVQRGATLRRLAMQVDLHTRLEAKLPKWFLQRAMVTVDRFYPNECCSKIFSRNVRSVRTPTFTVPLLIILS
ncbi:hypothetical protein RvY_07192-2 [Ramazzottius varieornatus]|uniref:Ion transport domain-containing protein n=1 Tax=Ramazzottius varieornatus TaxID=947166 RepID=A0A1D1V176_RAMVA|nr:hypothetical protein RvY_07192-2 [Ramazzottius varieornatus]